MKAWHEEFPKLLENLIGELENNGLETIINEELLVNGKIELECKVSKNIFDLDLSNDFELIINFPDSFPYFRPEVVAKGISLPRHQNLKTGNLCLIPRPSMYWNVGTSILIILRRDYQ